jgi:hypothetical protein
MHGLHLIEHLVGSSALDTKIDLAVIEPATNPFLM